MKETEDGYFEKGAFYYKSEYEEEMLREKEKIKLVYSYTVEAPNDDLYSLFEDNEETVSPEKEFVGVARHKHKRYRDALTFIEIVAGIATFLSFLLIMSFGGWALVVILTLVVWMDLYLIEEL